MESSLKHHNFSTQWRISQNIVEIATLYPCSKQPDTSIELNNRPIRCDLFSLWYFCRQLYMFRVLTPKLFKGKAVPLEAWSGPDGSRKLRFPDFVTTAQDGGKVVSLTHRPPLPPGNAPGTHFCQRLSRLQGHSAIGRISCQWKIHWQQLGSNQRPSDL